MNTKLTLTIKDSVVRRAKKYAKKRGKSLSGMIENYLKAVTNEEQLDEELSPIVKSLKGSFTEPEDFNYKKELESALIRKYLTPGE